MRLFAPYRLGEAKGGGEGAVGACRCERCLRQSHCSILCAVASREKAPNKESLWVDSSSVLAGVQPLALVRIELLLDGRLTFYRSACRVCGELCIAVFADSHHGYIGPSPHDPQIALRHAYPLPGWQINVGLDCSRGSFAYSTLE
jgi:hypothetical protein